MNILAMNTWFVTLIKQFFFSLDQVVFNFISEIYNLLISIARTSILTQADIANMAEKVYALLTVFMVFKVTLSLITYVVNPDDFADKSKGLSKLGTNIIISLSLLVLTPYIFSYAFELQTIILEDNSLAKLIFETEGDDDSSSFINTAGDEIAFTAMSAFFTPNVSIDQLRNCVELEVKDENDKKVFNPACSGVTKENDTYNVDENPDANTMAALISSSGGRFKKEDLINYVAGVENENLGLMFRQDLAVATVDLGKGKGQEYVMEYKFVFSTVVGVVIILLLLTYCMDIALRSIKLSFLQLISPIPILSYVDPKSGKDGLFKKWYDMCFKTYLSLFIRLLALYFAIYIIQRVDSMVDIVDGSYVTDIYIKIFVIIGALMFAKQLPKMLEGLGIKLDGDGKFTLNPLKKFEEGALGGKQILGAGKGLAAGAMIGAAALANGDGVIRGASSILGGLKSGIQGKKFEEIRKDQATKNAELRRARASGSTFAGRMGARINGYLGLPGTLGKVEHDKMETQNRIDELNAQKKIVTDRITPKRTVIANQRSVKKSIDGMESYVTGLIEAGKAGNYSSKYKALGTDHEYLTNNIGQEAAYEIKNASGETIVKKGQIIEGKHAHALNGEKERYSKKIGRSELMDELLAGKSKEAGTGQVGEADLNNFAAQKRSYDADVETLNNSIKAYRDTADSDDIDIKEVTAESTFTEIHEQAGNLETLSIDVETSIKPQEAQIKQIEAEVATNQVRLDELNAQEKRAKANVEVTHATQGGPADPDSIVPPEHTVGYRTGGPGSGMGRPGGRPGGGPGPGRM